MTEDQLTSACRTTRDFTVAVFVVAEDWVLLHRHRKLGKWLPPGGHIEPHELPDDAARREVWEESGLAIELAGSRGLPADHPGQPVQLIVPAGIQLERISPGHEHIDLVYFARPRWDATTELPHPTEGFRWFSLDELDTIPVAEEVRDWCKRAFRALPR